MSWTKRLFDRVWRVTTRDAGASGHVATGCTVVFLEDDEANEVVMGLVGNGAPRPFGIAHLTRTPGDQMLTGPITARGGAPGTTYRLEVTQGRPCDPEAIREGICSSPGKHVIRFEISANSTVGAQGGPGGGTWHAED
jgi:hypothetical protein